MKSYPKEQIQAYKEKNKQTGRLLIKCPDQPGIVSSVTQFLHKNEANIIESNQYTTDPQDGKFFMRIEFESSKLPEAEEELRNDFGSIADTFDMEWSLKGAYDVKKTAIFVSKELHCLRELLLEWQSGDLIADIKMVVSNHEDCKELVESFGLPFFHIPSNKDIRKQVEEKQLKLLKDYDIDLIVLARYMQILTPDFVAAHPFKIINIHHSFLPAFIGANPHKRAYDRGVKLIGATSHYVTNDLDEGPIIEQDIVRVDHRDSVNDLKKMGRSVERIVLARGVKWDLEDRLIVHENKTIVF
ncbi:formyltetrahydrofolate deformylase [Halobacillus andaensis]|uniref:Formyltetrahydrofolate deformylase n=1 Tax=Halobacillus andaensis TaxID=1176239 RepID=A0A917EUV4_HALAA|nr:formyltetrahydrofolate deformylase [Halobacillus andaensis]MBP2004719.1 formyltetrahydrofolate deformylase [Halobacillus andaensis]GGF19521.1 formyltetrahydrofolate deformylase [Halobacillus andaensis]